MATFKKYETTNHDRAIEDRRRHKELIEKSVKNNISQIISEESIVEQDGTRKIKIPIRSLNEYYFKYGSQNVGILCGDGSQVKGKHLEKTIVNSIENGIGTSKSEDIFEIDITIDDAIDILFDNFNLPYFNHKKYEEIKLEEGLKHRGLKPAGTMRQLSKKHMMISKIKRQKCMSKSESRVTFHRKDLVYVRTKPKQKRQSNAVIICIMDSSGSMGYTKKYLARSFYFLIYQFIKIKYANIEIIFISHTTSAEEVSEQQFFYRGENGGTCISSGYEKALEIINEKYKHWNIYTFHCSDGDNWTEDNEKAILLAKQLCNKSNLFSYTEIKGMNKYQNIANQYINQLESNNFVITKIDKKEDVWEAFAKILQVENYIEGGGN
ncbi:MAG: sporulation protein YhbH [Epulopiscium sp. Nele67-Bin005]|nr:MAG: sporulation protein YhbH [Epulopiscium sp. Nele67-Bin005]